MHARLRRSHGCKHGTTAISRSAQNPSTSESLLDVIQVPLGCFLWVSMCGHAVRANSGGNLFSPVRRFDPYRRHFLDLVLRWSAIGHPFAPLPAANEAVTCRPCPANCVGQDCRCADISGCWRGPSRLSGWHRTCCSHVQERQKTIWSTLANIQSATFGVHLALTCA